MKILGVALVAGASAMSIGCLGQAGDEGCRPLADGTYKLNYSKPLDGCDAITLGNGTLDISNGRVVIDSTIEEQDLRGTCNQVYTQTIYGPKKIVLDIETGVAVEWHINCQYGFYLTK